MRQTETARLNGASKVFHHENLREIDAINEQYNMQSSVFGIVNRFIARRKLEARVNSRARYYGIVYDLNGNSHPAK